MISTTAVIIGGGVTGLSTAYHLARKGYGRIIVLEKGPVGDGSSSRAAGIITGLLWSETGVRARKLSLELFRELSEDLDGYSFQAVGCLNLFDLSSWPERALCCRFMNACHAPFEIVGAAEMRARWPDLHPQDEYIGLYDPLGGFSEPDDYIPALARKCRELGVEIREHQHLEDIVVRGGRVAGVRTAGGLIEADAVVSTVYAWTNLLLERIDVRLPVKAFVHQRYVTQALAAPLMVPAVNANPLGGYLRPAKGGRLLVGIESTERMEHRVDAPDFHLSALTAPAMLRDQARTNFTPYVPALESVSWEIDKVGLLTFAMDGEPILGPITWLRGLFVGVAFHSGGFAYNPVSGMLLAEFVADSQTSIDVSAFSPDRFDQFETERYLAETLAQKNAVRRRH